MTQTVDPTNKSGIFNFALCVKASPVTLSVSTVPAPRLIASNYNIQVFLATHFVDILCEPCQRRVACWWARRIQSFKVCKSVDCAFCESGIDGSAARLDGGLRFHNLYVGGVASAARPQPNPALRAVCCMNIYASCVVWYPFYVFYRYARGHTSSHN